MYFYFRKRKSLEVSLKGLLRENIFPYLSRETTHRPAKRLHKQHNFFA
jgi:hypothetical protein